LKIAKRLAKKIAEEPAGGWSLILCGNVGTGKTHLACAIALAAIEADLQPRYETVLSAMRSIKETYSKASEITEQQAINTLVNYDLLILDEIGVQTGSEYEKTLLFEVINERYQWRKSTILISNLTREMLGDYLGERTMDRFKETGGVVPFGWESQRGKAQA
jgi:DNA replication protein DnaC